MQGFGQFGKHRVETPSLIRYGEMTQDEFFVSADTARNGIVIKNESATENMVFLKHFGPGNPQAPIGEIDRDYRRRRLSSATFPGPCSNKKIDVHSIISASAWRG